MGERENFLEGEMGGKKGLREWKRHDKTKFSRRAFYPKPWERFFGSMASHGELGDKRKRSNRRVIGEQRATEAAAPCTKEANCRLQCNFGAGGKGWSGREWAI